MVSMRQNVCLIGCGHVGLVTAACLAEIGNRVICVDSDAEKITHLTKGVIPFYEPDLEQIVHRNMNDAKLSFTTNIEHGVRTSDIIFIAVDTPQKRNGEADLVSVEAVSRDIAEAMNSHKVIVEKSTVPVGTGGWIRRTINLHHAHNIDFDIVANPEFLREGSAIYNFMKPDRIVIGVESERAANIMTELYRPLNALVIITDIETAELIKHASNSFLALKISYINAIANICERVGADVLTVAEGIGCDKRIGRDSLNAGVGYGGPCLPKDVAAFIKISEKVGYDFELLKVVQKLNHSQKQQIVGKLRGILSNFSDKTVGILGLSFKPDTDDVREAPSIDIIKQLQKEGAKIRAYDPKAMDNARKIVTDVKFCQHPYQVAQGSDGLIIVTEWDEFKGLDLLRIKQLLNQPVIIDGRNIFDFVEMKNLGFTYQGVGR